MPCRAHTGADIHPPLGDSGREIVCSRVVYPGLRYRSLASWVSGLRARPRTPIERASESVAVVERSSPDAHVVVGHWCFNWYARAEDGASTVANGQ